MAVNGCVVVLERRGIDFHVHENKFLYIADCQKAQQILDDQLNTQFANLLNGFSQRIFPDMEKILGPYLSYYSILWQSEWATDLIFDTPGSLGAIMESLIHHAHITGTSNRVLRYLDRPLTKSGKPYANSSDSVMTRINSFNGGVRLPIGSIKTPLKCIMGGSDYK